MVKSLRKICIINQKGGVGKTTTAVNLCAGLSRNDRRVLLIDLDAQANISSCLAADSQKNVYNILAENADVDECLAPLGKNFDVIKSDERLLEAENLIRDKPRKEFFLREKLSGVNGYDYVVVDCPPAMGLLSTNALLFCSEAIIPASTDVLGFDAIAKIINFIQKTNEEFSHDLRVSKIVPTMHDQRNRICVQILKQMQNEYYELITDPIRVNSKLKEAPQEKKSIFAYDSTSRGAQDYEKLVRHVMRDEAKIAALAKSPKPRRTK